MFYNIDSIFVVEIISKKESSEKMKLGNMSKETNSEKFFTSLESPRKNDVNRHAKDSEDNITTMSRCRHSSTIKDLIKQFVNNFNLLASKEKRGQKCKATKKEGLLTNGVLLIVLSNDETHDATSLNEKMKP